MRAIVATRVIGRGKNRGMVEATLPEYDMTGHGRWRAGRKIIVTRTAIIQHPEDRHAAAV